MSQKLYLFGRWWRLDRVLFVMCPIIIGAGQVLDWIFELCAPTTQWILGATVG